MIPIFVPMGGTVSGPTFDQHLDRAALRYSTSAQSQSDFKAGALWAHNYEPMTDFFTGFIPFFLIAVFVLLQIMGVILGMIDGSDKDSGLQMVSGKWRIALVLYWPSRIFGRWMVK